MSWLSLKVSPCATHHLDASGEPAYAARFDTVQKFHAPGLAPVRHQEYAWHIDASSNAAYGSRFLNTFGFYEGLAAVVAREGWLHIRPDGSKAYPRAYDWCGNFQEKRCPVRDSGGHYFHITAKGKDAYPERWRYAGDYRDSIAVVQRGDGLSTHITLDGALLHGRWFIDLDVFHKGYARARDDAGWMHLNTDGQPAYRRRFSMLEPFYNGQARVERFDGALEVIDENGTCVTELRPARRSEFSSLSEDMVGFWKTQTIAAAVALGVIETLPATALQVAEACRLNASGAERLMRALCELNIAWQEPTGWALTPRGEFLRASHSLTLADAAIEYAGPLSELWKALPNALSLNAAWSAPDIFGDVARDQSRLSGHHRMLRSYARHDYAQVCNALDLRGDERVIDAGGGLGVLAQLILDANPAATITVLERPEVVAIAPQDTPLRWVSGNLFDEWKLEADAVVLSRVLHDWDDREALTILSRARSSLTVGGRVFIIEMLAGEEEAAGALCDLHLLVATGGRERSQEHFEVLLSKAGFKLESVRKLPTLPSVLVGVAV